MKQHMSVCQALDDDVNIETASSDIETSSPVKRPAPPPDPCTTPPTKRVTTETSMNMKNYVMQTSKSEKEALDAQVARYIYATNTPFSAAAHSEFVKLVQMLRPGYTPLAGLKWVAGC